ncbi:3739_t:CDS:2 [Acaulospora colombiana]|uniref:3739_t:CDS:1 n=1 Tax=Acaulospora colombiana TaxID=27376 RepID=A0ACA9N7F7_9GLOM|nr:3739_t:CDS:2 [Acaulospora colombiana]
MSLTLSLLAPNPDDYEAKYPADEFGEEAGPNARFWRVYLDEAEVFDMEMTEGWKDTIDVLLAGLFSAVVTTFVAQTSQSLDYNYSKISTSLLTELVGLQRAQMEGSSPGSVNRSELNFSTTPFKAEKSDRWVNGLWFTSLSLSLSTALFSVLVKQWIQNYISTLTGDVRGRVHTRQFRYNGLETWHVRGIIGWLPVMMHTSLCIFFIGLVIFLASLDSIIPWLVCSLASVSYGLYAASNILPMKLLNCPFRTPVSEYAYWLFSFTFRHASKPFIPPTSLSTVTLKQMESRVIEKINDTLDTSSFTWLTQNSSSPTAMSVALQSISGMEENDENTSMFLALDMTYDSSFPKIWRNEVASFVEKSPDDSDEYLRIERFSRSILKLSLIYLNQNRDFLRPPNLEQRPIQDVPPPLVPSFALLRDGSHSYITRLRERGLSMKMPHLVICAAGLSCMLGRMFPGSSESEVQNLWDGDHEIDIVMSLTSIAEVLNDNPAQDEKLRQYFTLFLHHLHISLNHSYRARESEVWYDLERYPQGKTIIWSLFRLAKYFFKPRHGISVSIGRRIKSQVLCESKMKLSNESLYFFERWLRKRGSLSD